ncbi:PBECR2 nuclease fold domain-containing protein [Picosynechococcus sp. NKBG15041c]|uniref:PBECR2 nuclease fold domain-containing protein n=1 Tax=Picosynechococcus sp. NKBG15041c TaxID=1407650 RepID=UPI0004654F7D|nr:PBECR2 nuclease fold domain-containing protein [Picosynechococcus sp. NKBG15041c]
MDKIAFSKNGVRVRLPDERWQHIIERHGGLEDKQTLLLEAIANPDRIILGNDGALMAIREMEVGKVLVVVYKEETADDGFVITAFPTRRLNSLNRRHQIWP